MKRLDKLASNTAVIDLFAGPGGLSLGFQKAGFKIVAAIEFDENAGKTYEHNFPNTTLLKDKIENVDPQKLLDILVKGSYPRVVLVGGPPCQPFSTANRQTNGTDNPQASAVDYFVTFIERIKPDAFLFENVVSFQNMNQGRSMEIFNQRLQDIGFQTSVKIIQFENFNVPQRRRRLIVGGLKKDYQTNFKLCPKENNGTKITVKDAISDLPLLGDGGGGMDEMDYPRRRKLTPYQRKVRNGSIKLHNHWCSKNSKEVVNTMKYIKRGSSLNKSWESLPESIKARYKNPKAIHNNIYKRLSWRELSPTIVHARRAMLLHPRVNRIITVREAARIQSFPDTFQFKGGIHSQYQQVANAVPPEATSAIAKSILFHFCQNN